MNDRPLELEPDLKELDEETLSDEAAKAAEEAADEVIRDEQKRITKRALQIELPRPTPDGIPHWVILPEGFTFPRGKMVLFLRFKSSWTDAPWKGSPMHDTKTGENFKDADGKDTLWRQCIVWPINTGDKRNALSRAMRDPNKAADEMAKQMIRATDGIKSDWTTVQQEGVETFWNELGERCRGLLSRVFTQLHVLDQDSTQDFLEHCIEARSTGD
jgi:hypothetical protein